MGWGCRSPGLTGKYMALPMRLEISDFFSEKPLACLDAWPGSGVGGALLLFFAVRFGMAVLAATLPVPGAAWTRAGRVRG